MAVTQNKWEGHPEKMVVTQRKWDGKKKMGVIERESENREREIENQHEKSWS